MREGTVSAASAPAVRTDGWRGPVTAYAIVWLLMLWPLLVNRAPFYSADSASYLRGGRFGFNTGLLILDQWWQSLVTSVSGPGALNGPQAIVAKAIAESGGARSVIYSVVTYLLSAPGFSLLALAIAQAGAVALVVIHLSRLVAPQGGLRSSLVAGAGVAFLTPAPWYAAYAMPDIFAGVAIAGSLALTVFFERANLALRLMLVLLVAFSISVHASHLPVALATLMAGAVAHFWLRRPSLDAGFRRTAWFVSPIVLALAAMLGTSYVAFGEVSLTPKRYPIQLARSVADGPGAWHLRDHCATERYAICEVFGPSPPRNAGEFLWSKNGVRYRATPEQMERIRAEESIIVRRAALEYPVEQIHQSATNGFRQLFQFGPRDLSFGLALANEEDPVLERAAPDRPTLKMVGTAVIYLSFIASILLLFALRRRLSSMEIAAISVATIGLLANAAVCGALSGVTDRYQGRVAWVLPGLALIILLRVWNDRRLHAANSRPSLA